jgi:hypothetical protein
MGLKGSGKDTLAAEFVRSHGYTRVAFADALKAVALDTDPFVFAEGKYVALGRLVGERGWEHAKQYADVRQYLQSLGMALRTNVDREIWLNLVFTQIMAQRSAGNPVVITDVRMMNEISMIKSLDGWLCRVDRAGVADDDPHVSENEWKTVRPNLVFTNDYGVAGIIKAAADIAGL